MNHSAWSFKLNATKFCGELKIETSDIFLSLIFGLVSDKIGEKNVVNIEKYGINFMKNATPYQDQFQKTKWIFIWLLWVTVGN